MKRSIALCALMAGLLAASPAWTKKKPPVAPPSAPAIKEWSLANGLRVVTLPDPRPVVAIQVWVHVGSKDEARDRRGIARLVERLMWTGARDIAAGEHARAVEGLGGESTSATSEDATFFATMVPKEHLDLAVRLESERLRGLLLTAEAVAAEREAIRRELRSRAETNPVLGAFDRFRELAYDAHPYAWTPRGRLADLEAVTPEDVRRFYDTYYQPNNTVVVVVGDVTEEEVRKSAERWFGRLARGGEPPRPSRDVALPEQKELRRETLGPADVGLIIGGYRIPEARSPDSPVLAVLARILASGETSRLNERIVVRDRSGMRPGSIFRGLEESGQLLVYSGYRRVSDGPQVETAVKEEVARLATGLVSRLELQRAKNQLVAQAIFDAEDVAGLASRLGAAAVLKGDAAAGLLANDKVKEVTAKDVQRVAKTYLAPERLTLVVMPPFPDVDPAAAQGGKP